MENLDALTERIQYLTDRAAVQDVAVGYATALDTRDWDALRALFTDDVLWSYPAQGIELRGPDAVLAMIRGTLERLDATQHLNSNHVVGIDGDRATHSSYFQAQHVRRDHPAGPLFTGAGRYDDRLVRTPDGWRLTHRSLTSLWTAGDPAILAG